MEQLYTLIVTVHFLLPDGVTVSFSTDKMVFETLLACGLELTTGLHYVVEFAAQRSAPLIEIAATCQRTLGI